MIGRTLGRVIMGADQGRVKPIKMEFSDASIIGHEWAYYQDHGR